MAPGTEATLRELRRRPQVPRDPIPPEILNHVPRTPFILAEDKFGANLRSSRRGTAGRPSGITNEHLRLLLDSERDMHLFFRVAELLARGDVPENVASVLRKGRLTALQKPGGGVRGIVAGDVIRRLVARTVAQQLGKAVEQATAPFQYALSTRAGCECVAHALTSIPRRQWSQLTGSARTTSSPEEPCCRDWQELRAARRFSHSLICSTEVHRHIGGRMQWVPCMRFTKVRVGKGTP